MWILFFIEQIYKQIIYNEPFELFIVNKEKCNYIQITTINIKIIYLKENINNLRI